MKEITSREEVEEIAAEDGSRVRELAHPAHGAAQRLSLAEASLAPGESTREHAHPLSEEIYCFTAGTASMTLGGRRFRVRAGDTVVIAPGTPHGLENDGAETLVLLCCCSPPYSPEDVVFTD